MHRHEHADCDFEECSLLESALDGAQLRGGENLVIDKEVGADWLY